MTTQHTPEPWSYGEDNDGWYVSVGDTQIAYGLSEENACRIVICVNACAGISEESLADDCWNKMRDDRGRQAALNAELVETMRHIIAADKTCYEYRGKHAENAAGDKPKAGSRWATPRELAQAAIAKAGVE